MVEAKASEQVKEGAGLHLGPDFFTFVWLGINIGQIIGVIAVGFVIQYLGPHAAYLIAAPFIALVLWPSLMNYLGEEPVPPESSCFDMSKVAKNPILVSLTVFTGVLVIALIVGGFWLQDLILFILTISVLFLVISAV